MKLKAVKSCVVSGFLGKDHFTSYGGVGEIKKGKIHTRKNCVKKKMMHSASERHIKMLRSQLKQKTGVKKNSYNL